MCAGVYTVCVYARVCEYVHEIQCVGCVPRSSLAGLNKGRRETDAIAALFACGPVFNQDHPGLPDGGERERERVI